MDRLPLLLLFGAAFVNSAVPGPAVLLTVGRAAEGGLAAGLRVAAGAVTAAGLLVAITLAVLLGLLMLSPAIFLAMKALGILVLVVVAVAMVRPKPVPKPVPEHATPRWHPASDLGAGLAVGLLSPVNLTFMMAIMPQFVSVGDRSLASCAATIAVVVAATAPPLAAASAIGAGCGHKLAGAAPWIGRASALTLLGFAGLATLSFG